MTNSISTFLQTVSIRLPQTRRIFLKGDMAFRGKVGKNIEERKDRNDKPYTMFSAFSIKKVDENFEYQWVRFFCFD